MLQYAGPRYLSAKWVGPVVSHSFFALAPKGATAPRPPAGHRPSHSGRRTKSTPRPANALPGEPPRPPPNAPWNRVLKQPSSPGGPLAARIKQGTKPLVCVPSLHRRTTSKTLPSTQRIPPHPQSAERTRRRTQSISGAAPDCLPASSARCATLDASHAAGRRRPPTEPAGTTKDTSEKEPHGSACEPARRNNFRIQRPWGNWDTHASRRGEQPARPLAHRKAISHAPHQRFGDRPARETSPATRTAGSKDTCPEAVAEAKRLSRSFSHAKQHQVE